MTIKDIDKDIQKIELSKETIDGQNQQIVQRMVKQQQQQKDRENRNRISMMARNDQYPFRYEKVVMKRNIYDDMNK